MLGIAGFALLGAPLLAYVWESLNQLLAGHVNLPRLLISVPLLIALLLVWRFAARWAARQGGPATAHDERGVS